MTTPINNNQASIALTQFIPLSGFVGQQGEAFGSIRILAGATVSGADTANGQILNSAGNEGLFQLYGSAYGGDGTTTFALPNLGGTAEVGFSSGSFVFGGSTGSDQVTLSQAQLPANLGGSAQPYNNYQPSLTITYLVALQGIFPDHEFGGGVGFVGSIVAYAGDPNQKPAGYALADGSALTISQNPALFALYGKTYGGDATHFDLPDLRGRTIIGTSAGLPLGAVVGQAQGTVSDSNLPVQDGGAAQPIDNREPSLALTYLIATSGVSPTGSNSFIDPTLQMTGEVIPWAISGFIPTSGWLPADGRQLQVSDFPDLFNVISNTYGGNGVTAFDLPDLQGRTVVGTGGSVTLGQTFGSNSIALANDDLPANFVSSGQTLIVSAGQVSAGVVLSGGTELIASGGIASGGIVANGGVEIVGPGGSAIDFTVTSGGLLVISSGGFGDPGTLSGGTEVVSAGGSDDGTQISGGTQFVYGIATNATIFLGSQVIESGGTEIGTTVSSGGVLEVVANGTLSSTTINSGGTFEIGSGATLSGYTVSGGITLEVASASTVSNTTVSSGGVLEVVANGTLSNTTIKSGGIFEIGSGATLSGYTVSGGVTLEVASAGTVSNTTVTSGGTLELLSGGVASGSNILSGGTLELGPNVTLSGYTVSAGVTLVVDAATVSNTTVRSGGTLALVAGGKQSATTINSGGIFEIGSGATLSGFTVSRGITLEVVSAGIVSNTKVSSGGTAIVTSGGAAIGLVVSAGGTAVITDGGLVSGSNPVSASGKGATLVVAGEIDTVGSAAVVLGASALVQLDGGRISGAVSVAMGATVNVVSAASAGALIAGSGKVIGNGGTVNVSNGAVLDLGGTINNTGAINLLGSSSATALLIDNAAGSGVTLSGGGKVVLGSGSTVNSIAADTPPATATVSATVGGSTTSGDSITLAFTNPLLFGVPEAVTYAVHSGDTLASVASGLASAINSDTVLSNRDISAVVSGGVVVISEPGAVGNMTVVVATVSGSDTETVTFNNSGHLASGANVTLTNVSNTILGAGTIGDASLALVNQAKGVIDATGSAAPLVISTPGGVLQNAGTLEATKPGGLVIANTFVSNTSTGVIAALGGPVNLSDDLIVGGTLKTSGSGAIVVTSNSFTSAAALSSNFTSFGAANVVELDGSGVNNPVKILGNLNVGRGGGVLLKGTIIDSGTITLSGTGGAAHLYIDPSGATLTGGGKVVLTPQDPIVNPFEIIGPASGAATLTNAGDTIEGAGYFFPGLTLINRGTINGNNPGIGTFLVVNDLVVNSATMEATGSGSLSLGTRIVNSSAGVILASGGRANVFMTSTSVSGGTLRTAAGGQIGIVDSGNVFSSVVNKGSATLDAFIFGGATLDLQGATFNNSGSLILSGAAALAAVLLDNDLTLSGGGTIALSDAGSGLTALIASGGSAFMLSNVNNRIIGGGTIGGTGLALINRSAGVINGNGSAHAMTLSATTSNAGLIEGTTSRGLAIAGNVTNSKTIEALGTSARVLIDSIITNASAGIILASGTGAHVDLGGATISGGTLKTLGTGAVIDALNGTDNVFSGGTVAAGSLLRVDDGGTLTLAGTITNSGTISAAGLTSDTDLYIGSGVLTLTGGGKVTLSPSEHNSIEAGALGTVLINVNNTIAGAGAISSPNGDLLFVNSGTVNANTASALTINTSAIQITNSGLLEATSTGGLIIGSDVLNSKTIAAMGTSASVLLSGHTVGNIGNGQISASGSSAEIELAGATILGGTLRTSGAKAAIVAVSGDNAINSAAFAPGALVEVTSGATLTLSGGTAGAGAVMEALSGGELFIEGTFANSGLLEAFSGSQLVVGGTVVNASAGIIVASGSGAHADLDGARILRGIVEAVSGGVVTLSGGTIGSATLVETLSGGTMIVSGALVDSGTLVASASASLVEIADGAVVSGGAVVVGNGIVDVHSGGSANVTFQSAGSGGLEIADTSANSSTFTGRVSGFGGVNHTNRKQFIDLVSVNSAAHTISFGYTSGAGSGTLTVSSGGQVVASIEFIGAYTSANFSATSGVGGTVKITDPGVVNGGRIELDAVQAFPWLGADVSNIALGAQTTLAYATNDSIEAGATPALTEGRYAAALALLGNYMAGSFATIAAGNGGALVSGTPQTEQQSLLTHPPHG